MTLSNFDARIMKVVQGTHHQGSNRYGISRSQFALFKSVSIWGSFNLDCILQKVNVLFKSLHNYRYLGIEDLSQEVFIENSSINVEFLNTRTEEITVGAYLLSINEIVSDFSI